MKQFRIMQIVQLISEVGCLAGILLLVVPAWGKTIIPLQLNLDLSGKCSLDLESGLLIIEDHQSILTGHAQLNGLDLLAHANIVRQSPGHIELTKIVDGLLIRINLGVDKKNWLAIEFSVSNETKSSTKISSLTFFQSGIKQAFPKEVSSIKFYSDSYGIWDEEPGQHELDGRQHQSMYMGDLFTPEQPRTWMFSFSAPQLWSDVVSVQGIPETISAGIEWWNHPFQMDAGEVEHFDTLYITHAFDLSDALIGHASRYQPHQPASRIKEADGYNSWEWFKENINDSNQAPVVDFLSACKAALPLLRNYILDNGWKQNYGDWVFNRERFPGGAEAWASYVFSKGFVPGVWLAPTWETPELAARNAFPNYGPTQGGTYTAAVEMDPSVLEFRKNVIDQVKALRASGIRYFKTDFLSGSYWRYTQGEKFRDSKYPPERVLREFMIELRMAMGDDAYWLACGTVIAPCAGLVDAARIGADIKPKWDYLLGIVHRNAARFWMHNHLWDNDQDFLIIRGEKYSKRGFIRPASEDIPARGFTGNEAETWCNYLVISGGPITWSDDPQEITPEGIEIVRRTLLHGGGNAGIPLDLQTEELPTKWVRRESGHIYLGLFNWSEGSKTLRMTQAEVPELKKIRVAMDILHDRKFMIVHGTLELTLAPHSSVCLDTH